MAWRLKQQILTLRNQPETREGAEIVWKGIPRISNRSTLRLLTYRSQERFVCVKAEMGRVGFGPQNSGACLRQQNLRITDANSVHVVETTKGCWDPQTHKSSLDNFWRCLGFRGLTHGASVIAKTTHADSENPPFTAVAFISASTSPESRRHSCHSK